MTAWEDIIRLSSEQLILHKKIKSLKPKAINELRKMGYTYDQIVNMLHIGKITAIKYDKSKK